MINHFRVTCQFAREEHRMTPKWPRTFPCQCIPYGLYHRGVPNFRLFGSMLTLLWVTGLIWRQEHRIALKWLDITRSKLFFVSLVTFWGRCTEWPWNDLWDYLVKSAPHPPAEFQLTNLITALLYRSTGQQSACYWPLGIYHVFISYFHMTIKWFFRNFLPCFHVISYRYIKSRWLINKDYSWPLPTVLCSCGLIRHKCKCITSILRSKISLGCALQSIIFEFRIGINLLQVHQMSPTSTLILQSQR